MPLKKASNKVQVLEIEGSKIHVRPARKSDWDDYASALFERDGDKASTNQHRALASLYRNCIVKLENVEDENGVNIPSITDPDQIVEFMSQLSGAEAGRLIDSHLLGLAELEKEEEKNSSGRLAVL